MRAIIILLSFLLLMTVSSAYTPRIVDRKMPLNCSDSRNGSNVTHVVMHFSSLCDMDPKHPYNLDKQIQLYVQDGVSSHYLVDREGTIYSLVDEKRRAWHAGQGDLPYPPHYHNNMNHHSIGIEMLGISTFNDMKIFMDKAAYDQIDIKDIGYTDAQYEAVTWLVHDISKRYNIPFDRCQYIGHDEWAGRQRRTDPGEIFDWTRVGLTKTRAAGQCEKTSPEADFFAQILSCFSIRVQRKCKEFVDLQAWVNMRRMVFDISYQQFILHCNRTTISLITVSYTHLRAHETRHDLVCRLLLEKKKKRSGMDMDLRDLDDRDRSRIDDRV
eukprot:TRINITY_DN19887_c0_g1_i1.p1 TRINITY_DN19887_c0_g1~~TRINITY_DN19887_c0_g1_i1.p1  ORF type:complete len:327 (+),score=48.39 TRINITY_DN19887_c0_g1_i1:169-1149(+)